MSASPGAPNAEQLDALARAKLLLEAWGYTVLQPGESRPVGAPTPAMIATTATDARLAYQRALSPDPSEWSAEERAGFDKIDELERWAVRAALTAQESER